MKWRKGWRMSRALLDTHTHTHSRAHSPTFPSLHLHHSSFSNPSVALPTSRLILQSFRCFTCVTDHSPTLLSFLLRHRLFTYVTWRAAHAKTTKHYCLADIHQLLAINTNLTFMAMHSSKYLWWSKWPLSIQVRRWSHKTYPNFFKCLKFRVEVKNDK